MTRITTLPSTHIFVFGSNLAGIHGRGAALDAKRYFGAIQGNPKGIQGQSYAIPTKDASLQTLPIYEIRQHVLDFLDYAYAHPSAIFVVTPIGTGLAKLPLSQITPLFQDRTPNVRLLWLNEY